MFGAIGKIPFLRYFFDKSYKLKHHFFLFKLEAKKVNSTAFANTLLGIMCMNNPDGKMRLKCNVIYSDDGENHFWLLKFRKKS